MNYEFDTFVTLANIFKKSHFRLYLVGGTVRDFLFEKELTDLDIVTDALPEDIIRMFPEVDTTFMKYGVFKLEFEGNKFDLVTLREESSYVDSRHPNNIVFTTDINKDLKRRDFTINAMYMDDRLHVIDEVGGVNDIKSRTLRMVGDPLIRLKEDPLRIIRALRFALDYELTFDKALKKAIKKNIKELSNLNPDKIKEDIHKIKCQDKVKIFKLFKKFHIAKLLDVVK